MKLEIFWLRSKKWGVVQPPMILTQPFTVARSQNSFLFKWRINQANALIDKTQVLPMLQSNQYAIAIDRAGRVSLINGDRTLGLTWILKVLADPLRFIVLLNQENTENTAIKRTFY